MSNTYPTSPTNGKPLPCVAQTLTTLNESIQCTLASETQSLLGADSGSPNSVDSVVRKLRYLPAYELQDGSLERCGRGPTSVTQPVQTVKCMSGGD